MKIYVIFLEQMTKRDEVDDKNEWTKDRALRNTTEGSWMGCEGFQLNEVSTARKI